MKRIISCLVLSVLLLMCALVFNIPSVKASGTIYIRSDGSVDPSDAPIQHDGGVYTLTDNVTSDANGIVIERDNMTLDGAGYTLQGKGSDKGIDVSSRSNVTIKNLAIREFRWSIFLQNSYDINIYGNKITASNYIGIFMDNSSDNTLTENNITANPQYGVHIDFSSNNTLARNNITGNFLEGVLLSVSSNNTFVENNVIANGRYGFYVEYSAYNMFYHNNIINNPGQPLVPTPHYSNFWDNGFEGNYWSDYNGTDADRDGIGDTPHVLNAYNQDNYPLMSPYISGDCSHDGIVNIEDAAHVGVAWNTTKGTLGYNPHADLNMDGVINMADADIIRENWLKKWEG